MKTLHITNAFHEMSGGVRTTYLALLDQAACERTRVVLVVPGAHDSIERIGDHGTIYRIASPHAPAFDRRYRIIPPHQFVRPGSGRLWEIVAAESPDVIEIADKYSLPFFAGLVRRLRNRTGRGPTLIGASWERLDDNVRAHVSRSVLGARLSREFLGRVYIGMFDAHLANSQYTADELLEAMRAPHLRPVYIASPGVHAIPALLSVGRQAMRTRLLRRFGIPRTAPCLIYAGRLSAEKQIHQLVPMMLQLLRRLPEGHLVIVGDGPERDRIARHAAAQVPGRVHLYPHTADRTELLGLIDAADVFVHPNHREPFGIGPLEAMACGVPVVLPARGGVLTYASERNAWLAAGSDPDALADAVARALSAPEERARRAAAARETAAAFAWPAAASGQDHRRHVPGSLAAGVPGESHGLEGQRAGRRGE